MMNTNLKYTVTLILSIPLLLALAACGSIEVGFEDSGGSPSDVDLQSTVQAIVEATTQVSAHQTVDAEVEVSGESPTNPTPDPAQAADAPSWPDAVCWYGKVRGDNQTGYTLDLLPQEKLGEVWIVANADIAEQIQAAGSSDKNVHIWGEVECNVNAADLSGCRVTVNRMRSDAPGDFFDPDPVDGWEGTLISLEPGSQFDDIFILDGDFPIHYGINGSAMKVEEQLKLLRDTGVSLRVWGSIRCGIPDAYGTQILVERVEVLGSYEVVAPSATPIPQGNAVSAGEDWVLYLDDYFGFQFLYPPSATITKTGAQSVRGDEVPEGMTAEEYIEGIQAKYGDNLCITVQYDSGYISISTPPNQGMRYATCGRTGVGAGEILERKENVLVDGQVYLVTGYEFVGAGKLLVDHNETFRIELPDGTTIEYGALPLDNVTYSAYLKTTRDVLFGILATYTSW